MRVLFNNFVGFQPQTGVGTYASRLAAELPGTAESDSIHSFPSGWLGATIVIANRLFRVARRLRRPVSVGGCAQGTTAATRRRRVLSLGGQARQNLYRSEFLKLATRGRFDLVHEPNQINWACDLPTVMTIHDLSPIRNPQWHPADRIEAFQRGLDASRRYLVHVLTDSEAIRREVIHDLGIDGSHVTAVAIGVGDEFRPQSIMEVAKTRRRLQLPTNYLLAVGTIEPRKNILNLMRSFCALPDAVRRRCPLVLAGGWGWRFAETQAFFHDTARHRDVIHVGYVAARDLPAVYAGARALVFPSYYEGFGLPPLEMLACGGAVLASDIPVTREVLGNHAQFIAPDDGDAWRNTMQRVITDDDLVNERRRGGLEHARAYSWRRTAEKTWNVYRRIHACGTGMGRAAA